MLEIGEKVEECGTPRRKEQRTYRRCRRRRQLLFMDFSEKCSTGSVVKGRAYFANPRASMKASLDEFSEVHEFVFSFTVQQIAVMRVSGIKLVSSD